MSSPSEQSKAAASTNQFVRKQYKPVKAARKPRAKKVYKKRANSRSMV